jgi:Cu-processing system ATP-binding protein
MLTVRNVGKSYSNVRALTDVTFDLPQASVTAIVGANGSGKTTLIKCIIGLVRFEGEVTLDGIDVRRHGKEARRLLGYLPQEQSLHDDLTVAETARFHTELKGVDSARAASALERAGLTEHTSKKVSELSGGMRQRLALGVTLLADPPLVILDEPAASLDIRARLDLRKLVQEQRAAGKSVLLSTHWLEDVPYIADTVLVLDEGRTVFHGPADQLSSADAPASRLYLRLNGRRNDAAGLIRESGVGEFVGHSGDWVIVKCPAPQKAELVDVVTRAGIDVLDLRVEEASISEAVEKLQEGM